MTKPARKFADKQKRARPQSTFDPQVAKSLEPDPSHLPVVEVRTPSAHPLFYRKRIASVSPEAGIGDLVRVEYDGGQLLGHGLYNPRAEITLRMLSWGEEIPDRAFWSRKLASAQELRTALLKIEERTDAYRVINAEGDGLPGLVIDRYGDVLSAEVFSLGMYQRVRELLEILSQTCGTRHTLIRGGPQIHGQEGFLAEPEASPDLPRQVTIQEFGTRFKVRFEGGHKTGFFCDQRENRRDLALQCADKTVLDLCCYSGGFAVQAKKLGGAKEVTGVDLDEEPLQLAKENAALNQCRVNFVQADAFAYMRDMVQNGRQYDVVILDPPKLIRSRMEIEQGTRTHFDMNRLAMQLVKPGGLLLSCTCAGLLPWEDFLKLLHSASRQAGPPFEKKGEFRTAYRQLQILDKTGAGGDHPIAANCPESEYLKAVWMRVL